MSIGRTYKNAQREEHGPKFTIDMESGYAVIRYDGHVFITMTSAGKVPIPLPRGFRSRAINHIFDLLVGRRSALWDDQDVFGENVSPSKEDLSAVKDNWNTLTACSSYHSLIMNGACQNCGHLKEMHE